MAGRTKSSSQRYRRNVFTQQESFATGIRCVGYVLGNLRFLVRFSTGGDIFFFPKRLDRLRARLTSSLMHTGGSFSEDKAAGS